MPNRQQREKQRKQEEKVEQERLAQERSEYMARKKLEDEKLEKQEAAAKVEANKIRQEAEERYNKHMEKYKHGGNSKDDDFTVNDQDNDDFTVNYHPTNHTSVLKDSILSGVIPEPE